jgi:hypothetical protein
MVASLRSNSKPGWLANEVASGVHILILGVIERSRVTWITDRIVRMGVIVR